MSELTNLQKQLQTPEEGNTNLKSPQDNLEEEVLVDTMAVEAQSVWMKDSNEKKESRIDHLDTSTSLEANSTTDHLAQETTLDASLFEDVEFEEAPPMIQAMRLLGRLLDPDLAQRALEIGDDGALNEARESLLTLVEKGLTPKQLQQFQSLSVALGEGLSRLKSGKVETELIPSDVSELRAMVDSGIVASDAVHSEIWDEDDETILAFQNLSRSEADEVQEDLATLDEDTISPADRGKIQAEGVTSIEVEEVLVDFWEAAQNEEYEVVEDED